MAPLPSIHGLSREHLAVLLRDASFPSYRSAQVWKWLYKQRVSDWAAMKNLPADLREWLARSFSLSALQVSQVLGSPGETRKILAVLPDGERVEEVLIPARDRRTVCVSTQVGCRYRCAFCASGQAGFRRNLAAGEIVEQVLLAGDSFGELPTHVVFMGMGEPFDNYDNALAAARILNDAEGLCIGARRITISTSGVIPGIERFAHEGLQFELSVSLHAPDEATRSKLMPINRTYPFDKLLAACRAYTEATGRIITFEYVLIRGVNDSTGQARGLARVLSRFPSRVNLIPLSAVEEFDAQPSLPEATEAFRQALLKAGVPVTVRASKGSSLKAACGQLRFQREASA